MQHDIEAQRKRADSVTQISIKSEAEQMNQERLHLDKAIWIYINYPRHRIGAAVNIERTIRNMIFLAEVEKYQ